MERELDKIEQRFKVYSRELKKDKLSETETGSEQMSSSKGGEKDVEEKHK